LIYSQVNLILCKAGLNLKTQLDNVR